VWEKNKNKKSDVTTVVWFQSTHERWPSLFFFFLNLCFYSMTSNRNAPSGKFNTYRGFRFEIELVSGEP